MAGISDQALTFGGLENKLKYNGIEFEKDLELNEYDAFYRELDPQIGRWIQIDPQAEILEQWGAYISNYNNPISYNDPLGDYSDNFEENSENESSCCEIIRKALIIGGGMLNGALNQGTFGLWPTHPTPQSNMSEEDRDLYNRTVENTQLILSFTPTGVIPKYNRMVLTPEAPNASIQLPPFTAPPLFHPLTPSNNNQKNNTNSNSSGSSNSTNEKPKNNAKSNTESNSNSKQSKVQKKTTTETIGNGKYTKITEVRPGKGPGQSRAEYIRYKNSKGTTIRSVKDSYDRANKFQNRKPTTGDPEGRRPINQQ